MKVLSNLGWYLLLIAIVLFCESMACIHDAWTWLTNRDRDTGVGLMIAGMFIALTGPVLKFAQLASAGLI